MTGNQKDNVVCEKTVLTHPEKTFTYGLFSPGIVAEGWIFVSGQGPLDMKTGKLVAGTIEEETARTLRHVEMILQQAGASRHDVVRCTCYLADLKDFEGFNKAYGEFFSEPRPARSTIGAALLKGMKVEIDVIARVPAG